MCLFLGNDNLETKGSTPFTYSRAQNHLVKYFMRMLYFLCPALLIEQKLDLKCFWSPPPYKYSVC